jgi:hypothetical protein
MSPRNVQVAAKAKAPQSKGPEKEVEIARMKSPRSANPEAELLAENLSLSVSKKQSGPSSAELEAAKIEAHMKEVQKLKERNARTMQRMAAKRAAAAPAAKENCESSNLEEKGHVALKHEEDRAPLGEIQSQRSPNLSSKSMTITDDKPVDIEKAPEPESVKETTVADPLVSVQ